MFKKLIIFGLVFMYVYTLTFNIFMTSVIRFPAPMLFGLPLVFLFKESKDFKFHYLREMFVFLISSVLLFLFAQENVKNFLVAMIVASCCAMYFNYFVGNNPRRLKLSVTVFYILLGVSSVVMMLNHFYPPQIIMLRSILVGELVTQTPSGITPWIFSFGYQIAALATFSVVAGCVFKKPLLLQVLVFSIAMVLIFYGMNRSALVVFSIATGIFWLFYFRLKAVIIFSVIIVLAISFKSSIQELSTGRRQNILAKNEKHVNEHRSSLMVENLKIIADYPFGVAFYGKTWYDVAKYNPAFKIGDQGFVTSHNAYLMFVTYLGIIVGGVLLWAMFRNVARIFIDTLRQVRAPDNALKVALCFSILAVCLNSFFHNEWLLGSGGPTLFLYFCLLQLHRIQTNAAEEKTEVKVLKKDSKRPVRRKAAGKGTTITLNDPHILPVN